MPEYPIEKLNLLFTAIGWIATASLSGAFGSWLQFRKARAELEKEYQSRFNQKKWEVYSQIIQNFIESIHHPGKKAAFEWTKSVNNLFLIGSDQVISGHNKLIDEMTSNTEMKLDLIANLIVEMRKDLGSKTNIKPDEIKELIAFESKMQRAWKN